MSALTNLLLILQLQALELAYQLAVYHTVKTAYTEQFDQMTIDLIDFIMMHTDPSDSSSCSFSYALITAVSPTQEHDHSLICTETFDYSVDWPIDCFSLSIIVRLFLQNIKDILNFSQFLS